MFQSCYDKPLNEDGLPTTVLEAADWGVIGGYFAIVLGTGLGISFFSKSKSSNATGQGFTDHKIIQQSNISSPYRKKSTSGPWIRVQDFLLAGRSMWFLPVAFSLFSSNIGSSHFIGLGRFSIF